MKIAVIGAGPAGLMCAEKLAEFGHEIHVFDGQKREGSKFLVAGKGGFNLTNSINKEEFLSQYSCQEIKDMVDDFDADEVRSWLESIQIPTYIGSSGKIFPMMGIKPVDVLNNWMRKLETLKVQFHFNKKMTDFDSSGVYFGEEYLTFDKVIFSLGGASWKKTGSDGSWFSIFQSKNIEVIPFKTMNVGIEIDWDDEMKKHQGQPIKNVELSAGGKSVKGELRITKYGLEGAPVYALTPEIEASGCLSINLKPGLVKEQWLSKLSGPKMSKNLSDRLKFSKPVIQLIRSCIDKETYTNKEKLVESLMKFNIETTGLRPIDEAISTRGGVSFTALNPDLSIKTQPNFYCVGEMVDWHAPTGGYLLQACFSMGNFVAQKINEL